MCNNITTPQSVFSDDVRQHLSIIQGVITRMNSNSFSMKGWMVAIVSALLAVFAASTEASCSYLYFIAALAADIIFCLLDAYYLKMEMQYRDLYDEVRKNPINTDFNMDACRFSKSLCEALKSKSVWILYLAVFILLFAGLVLILAIK